MTLAHWTGRRIATVWLLGLALQGLLVVVPSVLAVRYARDEGPRIRRRAEAWNARWQLAESADSAMVAQQRASTAAEGRGGAPEAIVRMPSGRPDRARAASHRATMRQRARWIVVGWLGLVPAALVALTAAWLVVRSRVPAAASTPRAS